MTSIGCIDRDKTINHTICESSKLAQKEYKIRLGGEGDPLGIVQETEMVYAQIRIFPRKWNAGTSPRLWNKNGSPNPG